MLRYIIAIGMLVGLVGGAGAGAWNGAAVPALDVQAPIERVACTYNDQFCPYGRYRSCRRDGMCWCARCGPRYIEEPVAPFFGAPMGPSFSGPREPQYFPPNRARYPGNGCPRGYTVQDGLCKPYRGY